MNTRLLTWYSFVVSVALSGISCGESGLVCGKQTDCTQPGKPICSLAVCLACSADQDCKTNWQQRQAEADAAMMSMPPVAPTVACEASTGTCRECLSDPHCADARPSSPLLRVCEPTSHSCVGCLQDSDCMANSAASKDGLLTCDTAKHECIDCTSNNDCTARPGMTFCAQGRCSACADDANCASVANKPYCAKPTGAARYQCGECKSDANCTNDAKPSCNLATLTCETCTGKAANFCETRNAMKPVCDGNGACAPCTKHEDCASGVCYRSGDYAPPQALSTLMPGQCVPSDKVVKVTPATIANEITGSMPYLKLDPGTYPELTINREVVLVGSSTLSHKQPAQVQSALSHLNVTGGRVVLYDLKMEATATGKALVTCGGGAKVHARLARFVNTKAHRGIDGQSTGTCGEVRVNQAYFNTAWESIILTVGTGTLSTVVQNSQFVRSGSPGHTNAVSYGSGITGTFAFNMFYGNAGGITCVGGQTITDSVIVDSGTAVNGCTETRIIKSTNTGDFVETAAGSGIFHPSTGLANMLVDAGQAPTPALPVDFFGDARPKGTKYDIGSEEIR